MANVKEQAVEQPKKSFIENNMKVIIAAVAVVILLIVGIFAYNKWVAGPRQDKASTAIATAQDYFVQQDWEKALNGDKNAPGFLKIISDYSGTDAANLANLYAGLCYAKLDKWTEAEKFLDAYSTSDDTMVSPAAVAALGDAYANNKQPGKAVDAFKKAAKMADSQSPVDLNMSLSATYLLKAGIILESEGKADEALKLYQDIKAKYVNSGVVQTKEIDKYIEKLSQK